MKIDECINELIRFLVEGESSFSVQLHPQAIFDGWNYKSKGKEQFLSALGAYQEWSSKHTLGVRLLRVLSLASSGLGFGEAEFVLQGKSYPSLPVAFAVEFREEKLGALRIYQSRWAIEGRHRVRHPLFVATQEATVPSDILAYHRALRSGSTDEVLNCFEVTGTAREPSGGVFGERGVGTLRDFFGEAFKEGGISLIYHTFLEDGIYCAAEYTCTRWGKTEIPPQSGMEFWTRGKEKLKSVRIYDDIEQPHRNKK